MRTYGQYCPIARGAEIFAERWTPLIVRNIHLGEHTFNGIRSGAPGLSATLLAQRLRTLARAGIVEARPNPSGRGSRYFLSQAGEELWNVCDALGTWGARWLDLAPQQLDPYIVLWAMCKTIAWSRVPARRVTIRFDVTDRPRQRFWLLLERPRAEVCVKHPGFDEDIVVTSTREGLASWHTGRVAYQDAVELGHLRVDGLPRLVRDFPSWGGLSAYARVAPARTA